MEAGTRSGNPTALSPANGVEHDGLGDRELPMKAGSGARVAEYPMAGATRNCHQTETER
jgi:hypothetical protein